LPTNLKELDLFFDYIYIINLEHRRDRLKVITKAAAKAKLNNEKIKIFPAINGNQIVMPQNWKFTSGELGCLESHFAVLKDAQQKKFKNILVLEDDITFCKQFKKKLNAAIAQLPLNWDMLYLYSYHYLPAEHYSINLNKCNSTLSTVAYAVNEKSIPFLIEQIESKTQVIDVIFASLHQEINAFASKKNLCIHYDGYSDVKQKQIKYELSFFTKVVCKVRNMFN
jgi:GR25 family glycosyltransferase involved in LPS biosynthesis